MATFQVRFHRYNASGSRISGVQHMSDNDGFPAVYQRASIMLEGMRSVDPDSRYEIISILSHDYRGADCEGGSRLWETAEEFSARMAPD